jgi:ABC-type amino acid transport substrate-binding protein
VVKDDARYQLLADNNFSNLEQVLEDRDCAKKLANNEADLWFGSSTSFDGIISDANLSAAQFVPVYSVQKNPLYLAFSMDVPDSVVSEWQQTLDEIKADGTFESIQK